MPSIKRPSVKSSGILSFVVQFTIVAVLFFTIGFVVGQKKISIERKNTVPVINFSNTSPSTPQNVDFSLFWKVYETLPQKYLDKTAVDGQKILYGAISGMVRSLGDPYTAFLDPKQTESIGSDLAGTYEGVGIQIGFNRDKRLTVIAPLKGTPAEKAGVLPKDLILKIGDRDTFDVTLPEAVDLIRGSQGSKVKLSVLREGEEKAREFEIERAQINVKSVEVEYKDAKGGQVAVLRVTRFGEKTDSEWDAAVDEVVGRNVKGVIVDMRNNPGGLLSSAVHLGSEFTNGVIVKQQDSAGNISQLSSEGRGKFLKMPVVVLVNGGSASAAEIFAGAIADNNRGRVVGEKTFGKGSVQDVINFAGGSSIHVTIAKWLTPKGDSIHGEGITPDVVVEHKTDEDRERDLQLQRTLELL